MYKRQLIYRCRQELDKFYPKEQEKCEWLLSSSNAYRWNPDIPCQIDLFTFEKLYQKANACQDADQRYELFNQAYHSISGEFLPMLDTVDWVFFRSVYEKRLRVKLLLSMCSYLLDKRRFHELLLLCDEGKPTSIPFDLWGTYEPVIAVSYTHLDVYKRQL